MMYTYDVKVTDLVRKDVKRFVYAGTNKRAAVRQMKRELNQVKALHPRIPGTRFRVRLYRTPMGKVLGGWEAAGPMEIVWL